MGYSTITVSQITNVSVTFTIRRLIRYHYPPSFKYMEKDGRMKGAELLTPYFAQ